MYRGRESDARTIQCQSIVRAEAHGVCVRARVCVRACIGMAVLLPIDVHLDTCPSLPFPRPPTLLTFAFRNSSFDILPVVEDAMVGGVVLCCGLCVE